ncbi:MAG: chemotaxis-specific protein-glutamate methyltransferase CheB [Opitutales bacterium]
MGFSAIIVDDSKVALRALKEVISRDSRFESIQTAEDAYQAKTLILEKKPDLVILDIGLPGIDGLDFLKIIMKERPLPVVIHSGMAGEGSKNASLALEYGALDVIEKTSSSGQSSVSQPNFCDRLASAAKAQVRRRTGHKPPDFKPHHKQPKNLPPEILVLIGASTGGPRALQTILQDLPRDMPPICITQHMPASMTDVMAKRLDSLSRVTVTEAKDGERLKQGHVYISPGDAHLLVSWSNRGFYEAKLMLGEPIKGQKPSVDALFKSGAKSSKSNGIVALLMTGMGDDGADGLKELKRAGAFTAVQSEKTCSIASMPKAAMRLKAHQGVWDLGAITTNLRKAVFASVHWYQHS